MKGSDMVKESWESYLDRPGLRWSEISRYEHGAAYAHAYETAQELAETRAMLQGRRIHSAVLEPETWHPLVYDGERRGKKWQEFLAANEKADIYTVSEVEDVTNIASAVWVHPAAAECLRGATTEVTLTGDLLGVPIKGRADAITRDGVVIDLKTAAGSIGYNRAVSIIRSRLYHAQLAFYCFMAGLSCAKIIFVSTTWPHDVAVYELGPDVLSQGLQKAKDLLQLRQDCHSRGIWPQRWSEEMYIDNLKGDYDEETSFI